MLLESLKVLGPDDGRAGGSSSAALQEGWAISQAAAGLCRVNSASVLV